MDNPFFTKKRSIKLHDICDILGVKKLSKNVSFSGISNLIEAKKNDLSFFSSKKYLSDLVNSNSIYIITNENYKKFIPKNKIPLFVNNVLLSVSNVTNYIYPNSLNDDFDQNLSILKKKNKYKKLIFGKNVLIGKKVKIGSNCLIGHNTIIESNVVIGNNCIIGSNVIIKNTLVGNSVKVLDGAIIGKKGFGFFPNDKSNIRYPQIGMVIIKNNVEIGCNNTIDRGSMSNTVIGENTYLDNQVHIAHNVKIGRNCIITGQVGFAGSSIIGDKVMIGGQAGISGHIKVGNNVQIGGGSGIIKNIPDNCKVMGYPAKDIRTFLRDNK